MSPLSELQQHRIDPHEEKPPPVAEAPGVRAASGCDGFPRRLFLTRSLQILGGVLLGPLLGSTHVVRAGESAAPSDLLVLSETELAIAEAVADTLIPEGGPYPVGARSVDLARRLDRFLAVEPPGLVRGVRSALWAVELGAPVLAARFGRLSRMSPSERADYFAALPHRYPLAREVYAGLKQAFLFLFYTVDETWEPIGYDGPWLFRDNPDALPTNR